MLHTGDLAHADADGYFHVTRRLARFAKAYGLRVSLDDIEARLLDDGPVAAVCGRDEQIRVFVEAGHRSPAACRRSWRGRSTFPPGRSR